jgi:S-DNA-T family DNA segregation ATPase FtsK/SpoIIIE
MSRIAFHRPARYLLPDLPTTAVVLPVPPEEPTEGPGGGAWSLVLPLLSSVGMAAYMVTFGRPAMIIIGVMFFFASAGAVVAMRFQQRSVVGKQLRKQRARYRALLKNARGEAKGVAAAQRTVALLGNPEPVRLWSIAHARNRAWERRQQDADFLQIRLGLGEVSLATPLALDPKMDPLGDYDWESLNAANRLIDRMALVSHQPLIVDIGRVGVLSVLGRPERVHEVVRALLCQVAVLHAPDDVLIAIETSGGGEWQWATWLPHAIEPHARGKAGIVPLVAPGPAELAAWLEGNLARRLEDNTSRRSTMGADRDGPPVQQRLIFISTGFQPVSEWGRSDLFSALLAAAGPTLGVTLIHLGERETAEPSRVDLRLRVTDDRELRLEGRTEHVVSPAGQSRADTVSPLLADLIARELAPLRLSDEREQVLSRIVPLTEMVLGGDPGRVDIASRWVTAGDPRMLRAPIGTNGEGEAVVLDIKESAQGGSGPHGLIVGATGSGKSELLRTLVTGLAITHSPNLLNFVLVDFKGGAAFAPLADLPHVAGLITNLADDTAMIDRVYAALMGEQQRRQQLLRDAGNIDSIREYQLRQAVGAVKPDGQPLPPLPYLLIIVDEFGELLSGRPDFADLFTQIGRVGRSLGMHLLMATQRLEEGKLRGLDSHLSYRICLRTFSAGESRAVIGTNDAYKLPPIPGSAYLKVDESIYTRLRVAHISSPYVSQEERQAAIGQTGPAVVPFGPRAHERVETDPAEELLRAAADGPTELNVVVDRLRNLAGQAHQVWLPPLPTALAMDHLLGAPSMQPGRGFSTRLFPLAGELKVPLGILDIPLRQEQETLLMDFGGAHGHLALVGAPRTGRSTALRTIMLAGMLTHTPDEMQFYCIDFGGGTLHAYADAPHVGTVAGRTDIEAIGRTFAEIRNIIVYRERLFRRLGIDSIDEFRARRRAGRLPDGIRAADVFLLIDNWGALRTAMDWVDGVVPDIAARGLGAGVHLVLTTGRWQDIRPNLRDSIGTRIELRLNDPAESEVSRRVAQRIPSSTPGRGLAGSGLFFQLVLPRLDGQDNDDALREAQEDTLQKIKAGWPGAGAPAVRMLPASIRADQLAQPTDPETGEPRPGIPIGLAEDDLSTVTLDLLGGPPHFLLYGDSGSGKTTMLRTFIGALTERYSPWDARIVLFDYRHGLLDAVPPDHLGAYAGDSGTAQTYVEQLVEKLTERLPPPGITPQQLRERDWWEGPEIYVIVDDQDMVASGMQSPLNALAPFVPQAQEIGLHLIMARRVSGISRSIGDQVLGRIRDLGCAGLVLSGDRREGVIHGDERAAARPPGRGMLVERSGSRLIQIAQPAPALEEKVG